MSTSFPLFFFLHKALTLLYCYQRIKSIVKGLDQARYWQETHVLTLLGFVSFTIMSCVPAASPRIEQNRTVFSRRPTHPKHLRSRVTEGKYLRKRYSSIKMRCQWRTGTSAHFSGGNTGLTTHRYAIVFLVNPDVCPGSKTQVYWERDCLVITPGQSGHAGIMECCFAALRLESQVSAVPSLIKHSFVTICCSSGPTKETKNGSRIHVCL